MSQADDDAAVAAALKTHRFRGGVCIDCNKSWARVEESRVLCTRDGSVRLSPWLLLPGTVPALGLLAIAAVLPMLALMSLVPWLVITLVAVPAWTGVILKNEAEDGRPGCLPVMGISLVLIALNGVMAAGLSGPALKLSERKSPWKVTEGHVWGGAGTKVKQKVRRVDSAVEYFSAAGFRTEARWESSAGNDFDPSEVIESIHAYLRETGLLAGFAPAGASIDGVEMRAPDYRFCLVSVDPAIVLMIPHQYDHSGVSLYEMRGSPSQISQVDEQWGYRMPNRGFIVDDIFLGTDFPYRPDTLWFDPTSRSKPTPIKLGDDNAGSIETASARLRLSVANERLFVKREK